MSGKGMTQTCCCKMWKHWQMEKTIRRNVVMKRLSQMKLCVQQHVGMAEHTRNARMKKKYVVTRASKQIVILFWEAVERNDIYDW